MNKIKKKLTTKNIKRIKLSSDKISFTTAISLYFFRLNIMIKQLISRMSFRDLLTIFNPLQLIIFFGIIILIILFFVAKYFHSNQKYKSIKPSSRIINYRELPHIALYPLDNSDKDIRNFYRLYNTSSLPNFLNKLNDIDLKTKLDNADTYTFWIRPVNANDALLKYIISQNQNDFENISETISTIKKNFEDYNNNMVIFNRGNDTKKFPEVYINKKFEICYRFLNITEQKNNTNIILKTNSWQHLAIVIDNNNISFYLNGELRIVSTINKKIRENTIDHFLKLNIINKDKLKYQKDKKFSGFPGFLNYFNYYNRALNVSEINRIFNYNKSDIFKLNQVIFKYNEEENKKIYENIQKKKEKLKKPIDPVTYIDTSSNEKNEIKYLIYDKCGKPPVGKKFKNLSINKNTKCPNYNCDNCFEKLD